MENLFLKHRLDWLNKPETFNIDSEKIIIKTQSNTDFWQRTYYGFRHDNAHGLLTTVDDKYFSFTVKTEFDSKRRFDQCGVLIYQNSENWLKASVEYENEKFQRLGSVVTNNGYSDWASVDIPAAQKVMYYRLSRRLNDFCIENSYDGSSFFQMRIAHLTEGTNSVNIGIYACSPEESSFNAMFSECKFSECKWQEHI